jgi:hypothetical protein
MEQVHNMLLNYKRINLYTSPIAANDVISYPATKVLQINSISASFVEKCKQT